MKRYNHILPAENQHWVSPTFLCRIIHGEPPPDKYIRSVPTIHEPEKCSEIGWFDLSHFPDELTVITRLNLEHFLQKHPDWLSAPPGHQP